MKVSDLKKLLEDKDDSLRVVVGLGAEGGLYYTDALKVEVDKGPERGDKDLVLYIEGSDES